MRMLFTMIPATGHFHPLVPLARALESTGHTVAFAGSPMPENPIEPSVAAAGFTMFTVGSVDTLLADPEVREWRKLRASDRLKGRAFMLARMFPELWPGAILPGLVELCDQWLPDLIISDNLEFAGRVAAESREIPHAVLKVSDFFGYAERHALVAQMDTLRASVGLLPDPDAEMQFRYLYLLDEPPGFHADQLLPPTTVRLRRVAYDGAVLPAWVSQLPPRPTVYATAGTNVNDVPGVLERLLEALASEPINLILTVGRTRDPAEFGAQPPNVHVERYISQSLLMPYCDVAAVHGGTGTIYTALDHGVPLVNVPVGADQFANADCCAALGVGLTVGLERRTPEAIRAAVREVLATPRYRERARRVQQAMRTLPTPEHIVPVLERLAVEKRPILSPSLV